MIPVRPSQFEAIQNKAGDPLGTKLKNTFVILPILLYKNWSYMFDGNRISAQYESDLCAISCEVPEEEDETEE